MPETISNPSADRREKIANAAEVLRRSENYVKVFRAVYSGKRVKTISEIWELSGIRSKVRAYQAAARLYSEDIIAAAHKVNGKIAYQKIDFYTHNKRSILSFSHNPKKLAAYPTRSNPRVIGATVSITLPSRAVNAKQITIDDVDSFSEVRGKKVSRTGSTPMYESDFKQGLKRILGEEGQFNDWGGETDDLYSTRLVIRGTRFSVSFGLKGRATRGELTPKKMGKNGDQIQRMFNSPAAVYLVQYHGKINQSIIGLMKAFAMSRSALEGQPVLYGVIDGGDTQRLIDAYPDCFDNSAGSE